MPPTRKPARKPVARLQLSYLQTVTAGGRLYGYYRRGGQSQPVRGDYGGPEFLTNYARIHETWEVSALAADAEAGPQPGTVAALVRAYKASPEFAQLARKTRADYAHHLDALAAPIAGGGLGDGRPAQLQHRHVLAHRNALAATPAKANMRLRVASALFAWGQDNTAFVPRNPVAERGKRRLALKTGAGHRPWEEWEIAAFRDRWPLGTRPRTVLELALATGQRGGDIARCGRRQLFEVNRMDGQGTRAWIRVRQQKTGALVEIPQARSLVEALAAWLPSHDALALFPSASRRSRGKAITPDALRHEMRDAIRAAGLGDEVTLHGLRYTAATVLRELGVDQVDRQAILGHRTEQMERKYSAKRRATARAIARLDAAAEEASPQAAECKTADDESVKP
jgi:integrase